jgi:Fe/S biogenesis protein NfuA
MLTLTESAKEQVLAVIAAEERQDLALRVSIVGRGPGGFHYALDLVEQDEKQNNDVVLDLEELKVFIDAESAPKLEGTTIDFVQRLQETGFKFDNPNSPWTDPTAQAVQRVIDEEINPKVAGHGGFVMLLDVKDDVAYIALGGGCQGCGMADATLKQGVEVMIREAVPEIQQVLDTTDHAAGTNPYYQPAGGGESPF